MDLKENGMKRARMGLGRQLSHSMDKIYVRKENAKKIDDAVVSRLSKSTDNLCLRKSKAASRNITSKEIDRLSQSKGNLYVKKRASVVPNIFSTVTNRFSKSIDNLLFSNHTENARPNFRSKAINAIWMKKIRKDQQSEVKPRYESMAQFEDDHSEIDKEATDNLVHECLEFHLEGTEDGELYHGYRDYTIEPEMGLKEDRARGNRIRLGPRLSHSMDNLYFGRENTKTVGPEIVSSLSKSNDNLNWEREEPTVTSRNVISKGIGRLSESVDDSCIGKRKTRVVPNTFSKVTSRLSKSVDNLVISNLTENSKPSILTKATKALRMKRLRKHRQNDVKRRHQSMAHFENKEFHDTDSDNDTTNIYGTHKSLEFRLDGKDEEALYGYKDLTTSHYIDVSLRETCTNQACNTIFSFRFHSHHCRRCGELFCSNCLRLRRNLNRLAQPDPDGLPCKVCYTCFHENDETDNITSRSLTVDFVNIRSKVRSERNDIYCEVTIERKMSSVVPVFWREQFKIDIKHECRRLLNGFSEVVNNADKYVQKTVHELRKLVDVPAWQKSAYWVLEKAVSSCRLCHTRFRKFHKQQKLRNCRVCGLALCKTCANKELLIYFDDSEVNNNERLPRVSIIKYDGCPEMEPELSVLLYACSDCKSEILQRQLEDTVWFEDKPKQATDIMSQVAELHEEISSLQDKIKRKEDQVQRLTQEMDQNLHHETHISLLALATNLHRCSVLFDSNIQQQVDVFLRSLEATLSKFPTYIDKLKEILNNHAGSPKETTVLKYIIKGKCDFYLQHKQILCELRKKTGTL